MSSSASDELAHRRMTDTRAVVHAEGAAGRWAGLTLMEQMAHIGSEVERTIRAHERGREARFERALERALELFDLAVGARSSQRASVAEGRAG